VEIIAVIILLIVIGKIRLIAPVIVLGLQQGLQHLEQLVIVEIKYAIYMACTAPQKLAQTVFMIAVFVYQMVLKIVEPAFALTAL
jgi:hypothetical protein